LKLKDVTLLNFRALVTALCFFVPALTAAEGGHFGEMHWRMIGPFRAGRTVAISGVPQEPNVFYMAPVNGGVWRTQDYGRTWKPIFDGQDTQSVGTLAVAPSDPNIIYVGSGEGLQRPDLSVGDGVYKSTDGGKSWTHLGLRDGQQIASIVIDPVNPERLFVAVLGHPYGPNEERGIFRSLDGGKTFQKVLYKDDNTGAVEVMFDPHDSNVLFADLWSARQAPWEIGGSFNGSGSGLFRSGDGGATWQQVKGGLPDVSQGLGRIGFTIAPSDSKRMYAMVDAKDKFGGVYRSGDAGATWKRVNTEERVWGRGGDFAWVTADPKDEDKIYVANTSTYRSLDGGSTFKAIKGAPGGDDYHSIWVNPDNPEVILLGVDQGATISTDGGASWSSWYNQPTAQFYHVITDDRFPYWVYGGQQESGSAGVASRSDDGSISFREFHPVGVEEYGYVAPDPLNPAIIYGGKVSRFNWVTHDVQEVGPQLLRDKYRFVRTMPLVFSPIDKHALYLGSNVLFETRDGGDHWEIVSPDLSRAHWTMPQVIAAFEADDPEKGGHKGVIYAVAPSSKDVNLIWAGTDDGLIHVTRDGGKTWKDVTPKDLTAWSKVSLIEASHFDAGTAYAAINRFRLDDLKPHVYRTRDFGASWTEVVDGLPANAVVNAVREDPEKPGLLFAATEVGVFVSFDAGDHWTSLQMNLPTTSVRDLAIHGDDLVAGTHGRSFWILDDITPLRQAGETHLYAPQVALRWRWNRNSDTPLPPEEPVGENPPDGAVLDYELPAGVHEVTLEIFDMKGKSVRKYSSEDKAPVTEAELEHELNVPTYWVRPFHALESSEGFHRFIWDLHSTPPQVNEHAYPMTAIYHDTPRLPLGLYALPGTYKAELTVDGKRYDKTFALKMDPRIKTTSAGLKRQFELSSELYSVLNESAANTAQARQLLVQVKAAAATASGEMKTHLEATEHDFDAMLPGDRRVGASALRVYEILQNTDNAPTSQGEAAVGEVKSQFKDLAAKWKKLKGTQLSSLNQELVRAHLPEIKLAKGILASLDKVDSQIRTRTSPRSVEVAITDGAEEGQ
jgi:photosystem II stability/assembly factor-like uncharacterized protein